MARRKYLTGEQKAVLEDLFAGGLGEQAVLAKHGVSVKSFNNWLKDELFSAKYDERLLSLHRDGAVMLAKYKSVAAARLIELTGSSNQETARKACLDIINFQHQPAGRETDGQPRPERQGENTELSPEQASRLLAALAEEKSA